VTNATLQDELRELARWGIVTLQFIHNKWSCSVRIPGYSTKYHIYPELTGADRDDPAVAIARCFEAIERWVSSGQAAADRNKAVDDYNRQLERYEAADIWARTGFDPIRKPKPLEPERPLPRTC
jgi:hypothetical protein